MKKMIVFLLAALQISAVAFAQGIDLSGDWTLNNAKSKLNDQFTMAPKEIIITQGENSLAVEKHSEFQGQEFTINDKFTLDGQECINPGFMDSQKKSTVSWSGDNSSLKITSAMLMPDGGDMTIVEVYQLDAGNLVIESSASSSFGDISETMVFDKE